MYDGPKDLIDSTFPRHTCPTINPFHATGLFLYPLKTSVNLWFSDVFMGSRKRPVA